MGREEWGGWKRGGGKRRRQQVGGGKRREKECEMRRAGEREGGGGGGRKVGWKKRGDPKGRGGRGRRGFVRLESWNGKKEVSGAGGEEEGGAGWWAWKRGTSQTRTHQLEGRKREERVGELGNGARHKRGLTCWRGGRGRSGLVSLGMGHGTNEDLLAGGEVEGGAG